jgi:hypothetical protein
VVTTRTARCRLAWHSTKRSGASWAGDPSAHIRNNSAPRVQQVIDQPHHLSDLTIEHIHGGIDRLAESICRQTMGSSFTKA